MFHRCRIGASIQEIDWYWQQVHAGIHEQAQELGVELVWLEDVDVHLAALPNEAVLNWLEQRPDAELDALIYLGITNPQWYHILDRGLPIISLTETNLQHPLLLAPSGWYETARCTGQYVADLLHQRGTVLLVGGMMDTGEAGHSRLAGFQEAFRAYPALNVLHVPSQWGYAQAYAQVFPTLVSRTTPIDAIVGLTDPLTLAARDAASALGLLHPQTVVVGLGGYPEARAALATGQMAATADLMGRQLGHQALQAAQQMAQRRSPQAVRTFGSSWELLTAPATPIQQEHPPQPVQQSLSTQDISYIINRLNGVIRDRSQLIHGITGLLKTTLHYDDVQILRWLPEEETLVTEQRQNDHATTLATSLADDAILAQTLQHKTSLFIQDLSTMEYEQSHLHWPQTRTRIVTPLFIGNTIIGLLDCHAYQVRAHTLQDIQGIEYIAERITLCLQSANLYHDLLQARSQAEQADHLKTRLLANVSHEFRTPLNSILQQTQSILHGISSDGDASLPQVQRTLQQVVHQTQHLSRLVNDLLDLSRAEIDELTITPEIIATRSFLIDFFEDIAEQQPAPGAPGWKLQLPERLPSIEADPVRLRQILLNLLDNARKFTARGQIVLGADVVLPFLHIWVEDTGNGIPSEQQERIFEPFVTGDQSKRRPEGVGLGLAITRRLVALHRGKLTLDSQPGIGSTFHIYLPLPQLNGQTVLQPAAASAPLLYYLSTHDRPSAAIVELCRRQQLQMRRLDLTDDLDRLWAEAYPQIIAWDVSTAEPGDWLLLQRLRAHPHFSQVPFLLYISDEAPIALGMTNILTKPIERQTLITMLEAMMPPDRPGAILIVDDDPQTCELYQRLATHTFPGRALQTINSGAAALQWLEHEVPCLVILDLVMPEVDGFTVLEHLRSAVHTHTVPVLVLSGHVLSAEEVQRLNYARVIFQNKDMLTPDELATLFQHALAGPPLPPQTSFLIKQFLVYLQHHYAQDLSLQQIASEIGVSARHLNRIVHQELGLSPKEYMNRYRIQQAIKLLRTTSTSISTVAALVGFDDPNYFSRVFRQHTGYAPGTYRARAL